MQSNEELPADLLDPYEVLFFSHIPDDSLLDEIFEDDDYDSDANIEELTNKTNTIILDNEKQINKEKARGREKGRKSREGKNIALEKKAKISAQLPVPPVFSYLEHNVPFHQGFIRLLPAFPDNNIILYGLIRLFFSQTILTTILTNTNEYAELKHAGIIGCS
ncbi:18549_t:CDS:1, partial [Racocetra fulgida]